MPRIMHILPTCLKFRVRFRVVYRTDYEPYDGYEERQQYRKIHPVPTEHGPLAQQPGPCSPFRNTGRHAVNPHRLACPH